MKVSEKLIEKRVAIDQVITATGSLYHHREVAIAMTNLQRAFMFLGLALKFLGETEYPYPKSEDVNSADVDPATDRPGGLPEGFLDLEEGILQVKFIRALVLSLADGLHGSLFNTHNVKVNKYLGYAEDALVEARLWLGQELRNLADGDAAASFVAVFPAAGPQDVIDISKFPGIEGGTIDEGAEYVGLGADFVNDLEKARAENPELDEKVDSFQEEMDRVSEQLESDGVPSSSKVSDHSDDPDFVASLLVDRNDQQKKVVEGVAIEVAETKKSKKKS